MNLAFEILVIILSATLLVLLVISIVVAVLAAKLVKELRDIAEKGSKIADRAEEITETLVDSARASSVIKMVGGVISAFKKFKK